MTIFTAPAPDPATVRKRLLALVVAFRDAPEGAELTVRDCRATSTGERAVAVTIEEGGIHVMTPAEARKLAEICESAMYVCAHDPMTEMLPDFIMGLRYAADRAEGKHE